MVSQKIIVAGDICLDWLYYTYSGKNPRDKNKAKANWQNALNTKIYTLPGGVMLLNEFVKSATGIETISHKLPTLKNSPSERTIYSLAELAEYKEYKSKESFFRISKFMGYAGPDKPGMLDDYKLNGEIKQADLLVIDDAGNGFRDSSGAWKDILDKVDKNTRIIYKMSWPLFKGRLFEKIIKTYASQLILIINADDLREDGLNISRKLSWEKTILDFMLKIPGSECFQSVSTCPDIIIRFGLEGAIHYFDIKSKENKVIKEMAFHYFPDKCEGEFFDKTRGNMQGMTSAFVAGIAKQLLEKGNKITVSEILESAIPLAMTSAEKLLSIGFTFDKSEPAYPVPEIFLNNDTNPVRKIVIPLSGSNELNTDEWSILSEETQMKSDLDIAMNYVVDGSSADLKNVPIVHFGKLVLIDRKEIEKFRAVSNLMKDYFKNGKTDKPLSIGVFGPPGSGKTFGVKQLAGDILGSQVSSLEFNLSQFQSLQELIRAFHHIRDYTLKGIVPLIFFDEFDTAFNSGPLGWLKYFLAPMEEGEFRDGDSIHPIGKAIFVFAGGTSSSFNEFSHDSIKEPDKLKDFIGAKGPDFVSRLKGYVNITGVNQIDISDRLYIIRRAIILRALLKKQENIVDSSKRIYIDKDVLRAMLIISEYKHGSRSMGSIIEMSILSGGTKFEKSALPSKRQLDLHVDGDIFTKLVDYDLFCGTIAKELAKEIHKQYLINQREEKNPKPDTHASMQKWEDLSDELKESNRQQAYDSPVKLLQLRCFYRKVNTGTEASKKDEFEPEEIELLAEMEHKRWNSDKIANGWTFGVTRNDDNKIHHNLLPWKHLFKEVKKYDRDAVIALPEIFKKVGYEVYGLDE